MIRISIIMSIIISCCLLTCSAQNSINNRKELYDLLNERKQRFDSYTASLEKKSGIFGNKTKKDIRSSNEVLIEIVKTDNRIISALNRVADFKDFEKVKLTYETASNTEQLNNLLHAADTLTKQVDMLTSANRQVELKNQRLTLYLYVVFILLFVIIFILLVIKLRSTYK